MQHDTVGITILFSVDNEYNHLLLLCYNFEECNLISPQVGTRNLKAVIIFCSQICRIELVVGLEFSKFTLETCGAIRRSLYPAMDECVMMMKTKQSHEAAGQL